ncbi:hypothetical protein Plhal703r1_c30g0119681 [Plasmopara halstedii]
MPRTRERKMTLSGTCTWIVLFASVLAGTIDSTSSNEQGLKEESDNDFENEWSIASIRGIERTLYFELEHQLVEGAPFTPRGVVEIVTGASTPPQPKVSFSALPTLSLEDMEKFKMLLEHEKLYTVRAKADPTDPASPYVMTSVPPCMLAAMNLREDFAFHLSDSGKLLSMEYLTPYLDEYKCAGFQTPSFEDMRFGPFGTVFKSQAGSMPPDNLVVKRDRAPQGVELVKTADNKEEAEEESQSFLRKYWYIILPIVVLSLFGGDGGSPAAGPPAAPHR